MEIIKGDLIELIKEGKFDAVAQGCNCFHTMGAGIALKFVQNWPSVLGADKSQTSRGDRKKLGSFSVAVVTIQEKTVEILNCYTQYTYGMKEKELIDSALIQCLKGINERYKGTGKKIGLPLIGGKLAGGNKEWIIEQMHKYLVDVDATLVLFD